MSNVDSENPSDEKTDSSCRILAVDDEPIVRSSITTYLKKNGFDVDEAEDGESALARIHEFDPQIVLLDVLMPGITGNELLGTIKEWKPTIEVIMVTAVAREELKAECLSLGAFAVLIKPVPPDILRTTILKALEKIRQQP